jgi:hypothetical protein
MAVPDCPSGGAQAVRVNSIHHQVVRRLAEGFVVEARAPDGVIEAIRSTRHDFLVGTQWHPEFHAHDDPAGLLPTAPLMIAVAGGGRATRTRSGWLTRGRVYCRLRDQTPSRSRSRAMTALDTWATPLAVPRSIWSTSAATMALPAGSATASSGVRPSSAGSGMSGQFS